MTEDGIHYDPSRNPFNLGTKKYLVADEVVRLERELTPEDRGMIVDKYNISRGTLSNVLTALRKEGMYVDEYARGERTPPSKMRPREPDPGLGGARGERTPPSKMRPREPDPGWGGAQDRDEGDYITKDDFHGFLSEVKHEMSQLNRSIESRFMGLEARTRGAATQNLPKELNVKPYPDEPSPPIGDLATQAFQLFETGHTGVEVMQTLDLTYDRVVDLLKKFNELKVEERKREQLWGDEYITAWFTIAKKIGAARRDECEEYRDKSGNCGLWEVHGLEPTFRKKFPGLIKTSGKKIRLVVGEHPEICALCNRGGSK